LNVLDDGDDNDDDNNNNNNNNNNIGVLGLIHISQRNLEGNATLD
jgi:hypothetical protein